MTVTPGSFNPCWIWFTTGQRGIKISKHNTVWGIPQIAQCVGRTCCAPPKWQITVILDCKTTEKRKNNNKNRRTRPSSLLSNHFYLTPAHDVGLGGQQVHHLALALVAPLRSQHHRHFVARVVAGALLSGRGGLARVFVLFGRPAERHDGGGCALSVSERRDCVCEGGIAISVSARPMMSETDAQERRGEVSVSKAAGQEADSLSLLACLYNWLSVT